MGRPFLRLVRKEGRVVTGDIEQARSEATEWLLLLREEPDDLEQRARFEEWRRASPVHAAAWDSMQTTFAAVGEVEPSQPELRREFARRRRGFPWRRVSIPYRGRQKRAKLGVAVATVVAACAAIVFAPGLSLRLQADAVTAAGDTQLVSLDDGSQVTLGPDSALAIAYTNQKRIVRLLSGQAWFEVAHNPQRPFEVEAGDVTTTVLGTKFDVRMVGTSTSVAVGRGRVRVQASSPSTTHILKAGDWVRVDHAHGPSEGRGDLEVAGAWRSGRIYVRDRSVADVVDEIKPWYAGRIWLADDKVGRRRVSGVFDASKPEMALQALTSSHGGRVTRITPWLMIVSAN